MPVVNKLDKSIGRKKTVISFTEITVLIKTFPVTKLTVFIR
jgi:hypothetical protein